MTMYKPNKRLPRIALVLIIGAIFFAMPQARVFAGTAATPAAAEAAPEVIPETAPETVLETAQETASLAVPETSSEAAPEAVPETAAEVIPEAVPTLEVIPESVPESTPVTASGTTLIVKEVWLTGDTLHISVTDGGGEAQTLELNLSDYAKPSDEYVTIKATDDSGRESNAITFKNPYYQAGADKPTVSVSESAVTEGGKPFTPDGNGTVVDDATDRDGKEFFTVETPDGNTFYLIVDRQRDADNVYLLNAVTENDLASLTKGGDGLSVSAVESAPTPTPVPAEPTPMPVPEPEESDNTTAMLAFIGIGVLIIGGAAYYFKIVRPKKNGESGTDYRTGDYEDEEMDIEDDDGEDGDGA